MRKIFLITIIFLMHDNSLFGQGIYDYDITTVQDSVIHLSSFRGKQLLIVNTSLTGSRIHQYAELETLSKLYKDSDLVIIAIPTNVFDNTLTDNNELITLYNNLHLQYPMSKMMDIKGNNQSDLYKWLTKLANNKVMDAPVSGDFYKYLINSKGKLKGVFSGAVSPLETLLLNALMKD